MPAMNTDDNNLIVCYEVCSLVVLARPKHYHEVADRLLTIPGVDIHGQDPAGRFALTVETVTPSRSIIETVETIRSIPGVIDTALAFCHSDPLDAESLTQSAAPPPATASGTSHE